MNIRLKAVSCRTVVLGCIGLIFFFIQCSGGNQKSGEQANKNDAQTSTDSMEEEVMRIHDEVMPKTDHIYELKTALKDSLKTLDSTQNKKAFHQVSQTIKKLEASRESMMQWMRNYDYDFKKMPADSARQILKKEKVAIQKVKNKMLASIDTAESILNEWEAILENNN